jgi:hypothetical protein
VEQQGFAPLFVPISKSTSTEEAAAGAVSQLGYIPDRIVIQKIGLDAPVVVENTITAKSMGRK